MSTIENMQFTHDGGTPELAGGACTQTDEGSADDFECTHYKLGRCVDAEICGTKHHPHRLYPSAARWTYQHIQRLRFECHPVKVHYGLSHQQVIADWLQCSDEGKLRRIIGGDEESDVGHKVADSPGLATAAACAQQKIPYVVSSVIPLKLKTQDDGFLQLLKSFTDKYDVQQTEKKILIQAASNEFKSQAETSVFCLHRRVLVTWVQVCEKYKNGKLNECCLDDLLIDIINSAAIETGCLVTVKVRESTRRDITICGQQVDIVSNIEVSGFCGEAILQVVTFTERKEFPSRTDTDQILPQIASRALAVAKESPFGNKYYKTVYQISIHALQSPDDEMDQLCVLLTRCHISCDVLGQMSACPIPNPLQRSFIIYEKVPCANVYDEMTVSLLYRAVKAVLLVFHLGIEAPDFRRRP
ncbi:uncharacterized protein [Ptychodera flava]|uniref:uncharacterized protein n=1 Tax=Ptychodera flava TaxID=63121 RepID=UPI00396A2DAF